jgi:NADH:ubiquinone reductase (H+-translocating)
MIRAWRLAAAVAGLAGYVLWDGKKMSNRKRNSRMARGKRFVIVGAGFGGTEAARELARQLPAEGRGEAEIVLIDQRDYLLFTPMLTEAVGARIEPHHIVVPLQSFSPRIRLVQGVVSHIDLKTRTVTFTDQNIAPVTGDFLVISLGALSNFHHVPGVEQVAYTLKSLQDAYAIRRNAVEAVRSAAQEDDPEQRSAKLTFLVAGGGYTGVEGIAALNELVRDTVAQFPSLEDAPVRVVLAEPMDRLMSEVTPDLAAYAQKQLEKAGIRVLLKVGIKGVENGVIELANGERIRAHTFIWTAGVEPNPLVSQLGAPIGKSKGLKVNGCLELVETENVWAVGDCAEVPKPDGNGTYGLLAQNALREGKLAAENMLRVMRGEQQKPFTYTPIGELALVGRHKGVARVYGFNFSGLTAYMMWRAVYIVKLPSLAQRLRVLGDWCLDVCLGPAAEYQMWSMDPQLINEKPAQR